MSRLNYALRRFFHCHPATAMPARPRNKKPEGSGTAAHAPRLSMTRLLPAPEEFVEFGKPSSIVIPSITKEISAPPPEVVMSSGAPPPSRFASALKNHASGRSDGPILKSPRKKLAVASVIVRPGPAEILNAFKLASVSIAPLVSGTLKSNVPLTLPGPTVVVVKGFPVYVTMSALPYEPVKSSKIETRRGVRIIVCLSEMKCCIAYRESRPIQMTR